MSTLAPATLTTFPEFESAFPSAFPTGFHNGGDRGNNQATSTASSSSNNDNTSFIGNTPSTVLFFIAITVGVIIALVFLFFTTRYFVRTKLGIYSYNHRSLLSNNHTTGPNGNFRIGLGDLRNSVRYSRKKKLTESEVEFLFPQKTYEDWLDGGQEKDQQNREGKLQEEETILRHTKSRSSYLEDADMLVIDKVDNEELVRTTTNATAAHIGEEFHGDSSSIGSKKGIIMVSKDLADAKSEDKMIENASTDDDEPKHDNLNLDDSFILFDGGSTLHLTHDYNSDSGSVDITDLSEGTKLVSNEVSNKVIDSDEKQVVRIEENSSSDLAENEGVLHFTSGICAICIDQLEMSDKVRGLICGHVFHSVCLDPWLINRRACCPMCKRDYFYKDETHNSAINNEEEEAIEETHSINPLLNPFTPTSDRALSLLNNTSLLFLNLDVRAKEKTEKMFSVKFRLFWRMMGVTKNDLFNYSVISIYNKMRDSGELDRERAAAAAPVAPAPSALSVSNSRTVDPTTPPTVGASSSSSNLNSMLNEQNDGELEGSSTATTVSEQALHQHNNSSLTLDEEQQVVRVTSKGSKKSLNLTDGNDSTLNEQHSGPSTSLSEEEVMFIEAKREIVEQKV